MHHNRNGRNVAGITLVETVLSLAILGGAFVAALNTIASARGAQAVVTQRQLGLVLAEDLMAEILAMPSYNEGASVGPEVDELAALNRSLFDDIDDFHAWSSSPPVDPEGQAIAGAEGYSRQVEVMYVELSDPSVTSASDQGIVRITVTVKFGQRVVTTLTAYRTDAWRSPEEVY